MFDAGGGKKKKVSTDPWCQLKEEGEKKKVSHGSGGRGGHGQVKKGGPSKHVSQDRGEKGKFMFLCE